MRGRHENPVGPHRVRRLRHLRQARAGILLAGRLGYASLIGDGTVAEADRDAVMRALLDCPVHAIAEVGERTAPSHRPPLAEATDPAEHLKTEENEAEWGFTR